MEKSVWSESANLRYAANDTLDIIFRSKGGLLDLLLSEPEGPKEDDGSGMLIERVTIGPFQDKGFLAEITWVRDEPHGEGIVEHAHYGSAKFFSTAKGAEDYLNEFIDLSRYESRVIA